MREVCRVKAAANRVVCRSVFDEGVAIPILNLDFDVGDLSVARAVHHARVEQKEHCFDGHVVIELIVKPHVRIISRNFCLQLRF